MSDIDAALAKAKTEFLEGISAEWSELHEYAEKDFEAGFKARDAEVAELRKERDDVIDDFHVSHGFTWQEQAERLRGIIEEIDKLMDPARTAAALGGGKVYPDEEMRAYLYDRTKAVRAALAKAVQS